MDDLNQAFTTLLPKPPVRGLRDVPSYLYNTQFWDSNTVFNCLSGDQDLNCVPHMHRSKPPLLEFQKRTVALGHRTFGEVIELSWVQSPTSECVGFTSLNPNPTWLVFLPEEIRTQIHREGQHREKTAAIHRMTPQRKPALMVNNEMIHQWCQWTHMPITFLPHGYQHHS